MIDGCTQRHLLIEAQAKCAQEPGYKVPSPNGRRLGKMAPSEHSFRSACRSGDLVAVKQRLIQSIRDEWHIDDVVNGRSGLHLSILSGHEDVAIWLIKVGGASTKIVDITGEDAFQMAKRCGCHQIDEFLESASYSRRAKE